MAATNIRCHTEINKKCHKIEMADIKKRYILSDLLLLVLVSSRDVTLQFTVHDVTKEREIICQVLLPF